MFMGTAWGKTVKYHCVSRNCKYGIGGESDRTKWGVEGSAGGGDRGTRAAGERALAGRDGAAAGAP